MNKAADRLNGHLGPVLVHYLGLLAALTHDIRPKRSIGARSGWLVLSTHPHWHLPASQGHFGPHIHLLNPFALGVAYMQLGNPA
jgi:hypothetical protein